MRAAGLNFRDVLLALGVIPPSVDADATSTGQGGEGAGVVVEVGPEVGPEVTVLRPGDRVMGLFAGILLLLGIVSWLVVRVGLLPLDRIGQTAGAIAGGDLSRRVSPADRRSEVGRLGLALNAMLDRLESAFAERRAMSSHTG